MFSGVRVPPPCAGCGSRACPGCTEKTYETEKGARMFMLGRVNRARINKREGHGVSKALAEKRAAERRRRLSTKGLRKARAES